MKRFYRSLAVAFALALGATASLPAASAAPATGEVTGSVYTHGSERGMKIASAPDASAGGISWDLAAPKNKFHDKEADVWLIGKDFTYDKLSDKEIDDWYRFGKIPANAPVYHTTTDKKTGKYEFHDIPEGTYFLVILDSYGRDAAQNLTELDDKQRLRQKLPNWESFELFNVGPRSCLVQMVTVKRDETVTVKPGVI
ncbi:hypothetical protein [Mitsuokella multacida]|uniref:hypothetical protein n=1 Tax=Mitsuokella multacida TaxID=52226 RepID=UPI0026587FAF|nr:hypothetical protein [Mitsuokella multacida]